MRRRKPKRLTQAERRLLEFPPNPGTWICRCSCYNRTDATVCWFCRSAKPRKPKLLWPKYLAVCNKAMVEPRGGDPNSSG